MMYKIQGDYDTQMIVCKLTFIPSSFASLRETKMLNEMGIKYASVIFNLWNSNNRCVQNLRRI